jgi:hypothetical protein
MSITIGGTSFEKGSPVGHRRRYAQMELYDDWQQSNIQHFWGELASTDHLIQLYENEQAFITALEGFAGSGFLAGESVIIIGTGEHLKAFNNRLVAHGFDINKLIATDQFLSLDAEETLQNFMLGNHPHEERFFKLVRGLVRRAGQGKRKVRAFGEMVALLWKNGNREATVELEALWNKFCAQENLCLFCAYPKSGLTHTAMEHVCSMHTKIIAGTMGPSTQVFYKEIPKKATAN